MKHVNDHDDVCKWVHAIDACNYVCKLSHPMYVYEWSHSIDHANDAYEDKLYNQSNAWKSI